LFLTNKPDLTTPQTYSWNLAVQRQLGTDYVVSASYLATRAMHIWTLNPINAAQFLGLGPCTLDGVAYNPCSATTNTDARRLLSLERPRDGDKIGPLAEFDDGGTSIYHGMLLSLERRAVKGVTFSANYTLSHCIGPYADINSNGPPADETFSKPNVREFDHGNCVADRRQLVNITSVWQTPNFANSTVHMLASNWRLSGIYRFSAGQPLNVTDGSDRALNGTTTQRPNQILGDPYKDKSAGPLTTWLDPNAFAAQPLGEYGNVGYNAFVGPSTWSFDMAVSRSFNLKDMQRLEFRAEAFNVTNSFRPGNPATALSNLSTFGQIRTALDPRILQFALKYVF